ncbi:porin family protein [Luteimonas sp. FXH3W]|uniref:Porin family protein n=1 Tax=Aquilutibacter rugosus TaxID=3115820 RepID=A0ABU7UWA1_9GAMM
MNTKLRRRPLALLCLLAMSAPAVAAAPPTPEAEKFEQMQAELDSRIGDPQFDFAYASAALDAGKPSDAIIALQRVLALQPDNAPARAELARAYAMTGDLDTAKQQFETVVGDPTIPDPVRQRFNNLIKAYDNATRGGGDSVNGYVDLQLGHDSNINSATALNSITIPLFGWLGPGQLGPQSRAISDTTIDFTAGISGSHGISRGNRIYGSALASWRDNRDSRAFDQQSLTLTGGYAHTLPSRNVVSISLQGQNFGLGGHSVRNVIGAIGQFTQVLSATSAWSTSLQYMDLNYITPGVPDARRYALASGISTATWNLGGQLGRERTKDRSADADSFTFYGLNAGWQVPLGARDLLYADAAWENRRHLDDNFMFLKERKDSRVDLGVGYKHQFTPRWLLTARASWARNSSNIDLYDFRRTMISAGIRYEF